VIGGLDEQKFAIVIMNLDLAIESFANFEQAPNQEPFVL
jgi:hypothetical protein